MSRPLVAPADYADRTLLAYTVYARAAIASWSARPRPSQLLRAFAARLPRGARVLDYGCGIGTELAWLTRHGFRADGIDGARTFIREARRRAPAARMTQARFETVELPQTAYEGIWCQAALLHVPPEELSRQVQKLRRALVPGGLLALTLSWGRAAGFTVCDWIPGRYIASYSKAQAQAVLAGWRIERLAVVTGDGRHGRWIQILARAAETGA